VTLIEKESTTTQLGKVVYTAKIHTTGGREKGQSRSSDGRLDIKLSTPGSERIGDPCYLETALGTRERVPRADRSSPFAPRADGRLNDDAADWNGESHG
jgi:hypothetical protein